MGPRFFKRGEYSQRYAIARTILASMGPRFFKRGEYSPGDGSDNLDSASMGPRFFKRGEGRMICHSHLLLFRFNGATLLQAWRVRCWSASAATFTASMGPRFFKRGEPGVSDLVRMAVRASMGPRFFKRGECVKV